MVICPKHSFESFDTFFDDIVWVVGGPRFTQVLGIIQQLSPPMIYPLASVRNTLSYDTLCNSQEKAMHLSMFYQDSVI